MDFTSTRGASLDSLNMLVHGASGAGKTTLAGTTGDIEHTLVLSAEAGLLPLRHLDIRVKVIDSVATLQSVYVYLLREDHGFTWVILDSVSEIAERVLADELKTASDPRQAYGALATRVFKLVKLFRDLPLNVVFIAKQSRSQDDEGRMLFGPSFPGKQLSRGIGYEFDLVLAMRAELQADGTVQRSLQTSADGRYEAKDRSGSLAMYESPDLAAIAAKIKQEREMFDANDYPRDPSKTGSGDFGPIPSGIYEVEVIEAATPEPRGPNGRAWKFTLEIASGDHRGRRVWWTPWWEHSNETAQQIGREMLGTASRALGKPRWQSPTELIGRRAQAKLRWSPPANGYDGKIELKFWQEQQQAPSQFTPTGSRAQPPAGHPAAPGQPFDYGKDGADDLPF